MWYAISKLKEMLKIAVAFLEDPDGRREDLVELVMDLWEIVDPTPNLDLDDEVVETLAEWMVDWIIQEFSEQLSLS